MYLHVIAILTLMILTMVMIAIIIQRSGLSKYLVSLNHNLARSAKVSIIAKNQISRQHSCVIIAAEGQRYTIILGPNHTLLLDKKPEDNNLIQPE